MLGLVSMRDGASGSRLLRPRGEEGVARVPDGQEGEPVRRLDCEPSPATIRAEEIGESVESQSPLPDAHAASDERPHHGVTEGVRLEGRDEHAARVSDPGELLKLADGARPGAGLAEGREIAEAQQRPRGQSELIDIERRSEQTGAVPLQRVVEGEVVGDPILVASPGRRETGVEALGGDRDVGDHHVAEGPEDPVQAAEQDGVGCPPARGETRDDALVEIHVGDLSDGVHARVRATRDGDDRTPPDSRRQERHRLFEDPLDRALAGLLGPPREGGAVVGDVQTEPDALAHNLRFYFAPCFAVIVQDAPGSIGER